MKTKAFMLACTCMAMQCLDTWKTNRFELCSMDGLFYLPNSRLLLWLRFTFAHCLRSLLFPLLNHIIILGCAFFFHVCAHHQSCH